MEDTRTFIQVHILRFTCDLSIINWHMVIHRKSKCLQSLQKACPQSIRVALSDVMSSRQVPHLTEVLASPLVDRDELVSRGGNPASKNISFVPFSAILPNKLSTFQRWCMSKVLACRGRIAKKSTTFLKSSVCSQFKKLAEVYEP